ncbi:MAG: hypothetical protein AUK44_04090 [Porphyromonadaceae bacterium CG2_30_38_12]|nr:MAG: hypothetical protein AUK44_04090 [Porphyromonadaceae bacterium CG2_30_38_12]
MSQKYDINYLLTTFLVLNFSYNLYFEVIVGCLISKKLLVVLLRDCSIFLKQEFVSLCIRV